MIKIIVMTTHKGKPSGINKSEGTGTPSNLDNKDLKKDQQLTDQYTQRDTTARPQSHSNRNEDKPDATNAGGYKN